MIVIAVHELHKYYGSNHVLKGVTFEINSGEKVGLLGRNGSGKTTLFKVIAEEEYYESGTVTKAAGKKIGILSQIPVFGENDTVLDILYSSFKEVFDIHGAMKKIEGDADPAVLMKYGKLMDEYERRGGYEIDVKIEKICNGMNIGEAMRNSLFSLLSGGEKTRINLARILLQDCDILLLDEPTNHLDITALEWLEAFLQAFPGTVLVISHDRVFLDHVINRVIEIDDGKLHFYSGHYSFYLTEKAQQLSRQSALYTRQQKEIKRIEDRAKWFHENDRFTTKHKVILKRIDHMEKIEKPSVQKKMTETFNSGGYAAKEVASLSSVSKRYGDKVLLDQVSLSIRRNESIALMGENGCGKTTLIKMLIGDKGNEMPMDDESSDILRGDGRSEMGCDSGHVRVSSNANIAYMPQIITFVDEEATVLETLRRVNGLPEDKARSMLVGYLFNATDVVKKVSRLSGGERSRLKLCLLMQNKVNFLILDEPTNHLDIASREWIEAAVSDFEGTKLFISHDRYFLNKFAERIWYMKDGAVIDFYGGYDAFMQAQKGELASSKTAASTAIPPAQSTRSVAPTKTTTSVPSTVAAAPANMEQLIITAEASLAAVNAAIDHEVSNARYHDLDALFHEKQRLEMEIDRLYGQWVVETNDKMR